MELSPVWNQLAEIVPDSIHIAEVEYLPFRLLD